MPRMTRPVIVALLGLVLAVGIPTGFTLAANAGDAHGDAVSLVAKSTTAGTGDAHGDAVSTVAKANARSSGDSNEPKGGPSTAGTTTQQPANHGAAVSVVAKNHSLVGGPHHNHGGAVSVVAHRK